MFACDCGLDGGLRCDEKRNLLVDDDGSEYGGRKGCSDRGELRRSSSPPPPRREEEAGRVDQLRHLFGNAACTGQDPGLRTQLLLPLLGRRQTVQQSVGRRRTSIHPLPDLSPRNVAAARFSQVIAQQLRPATVVGRHESNSRRVPNERANGTDRGAEVSYVLLFLEGGSHSIVLSGFSTLEARSGVYALLIGDVAALEAIVASVMAMTTSARSTRGDWNCPSCNYYNYAFRTYCRWCPSPCPRLRPRIEIGYIDDAAIYDQIQLLASVSSSNGG